MLPLLLSLCIGLFACGGSSPSDDGRKLAHELLDAYNSDNTSKMRSAIDSYYNKYQGQSKDNCQAFFNACENELDQYEHTIDKKRMRTMIEQAGGDKLGNLQDATD